jgi:2-oxoisovalerate dehydrogenase E1 component alpha subunit
MSHENTLVHELSFIEPAALAIATLALLKPDGSLHPGAVEPGIGKELARKMYRSMRFIRILDERMVQAQRQGRLSFYLTCTGEEAAVIGSAAALDDEDMIMGQYREQGALAFRGFSTEQFMQQMLGTHRDLGKGRQMPIHYGCKALNFMTISSPLGTQIPQATGYAYGQKSEHSGHCTICYFGEGAASEGDFHAGLNMAAVLEVPVIFFCRNNGYAISTPTEEQYAGNGIAARGVGYGITTIRVDGNDVLAVYAATEAAREIAVKHNKPVLIEAMSYRLGAHSTSDDPSGYRSREEEDKWRAYDPIERMRQWLLGKGWISAKEDKDLEDSYRSEVLRELKQAEKEAPTPLGDLITDVYDTPPWQLKEQFDALKAHLKLYPDNYPKTQGRA